MTTDFLLMLAEAAWWSSLAIVLVLALRPMFAKWFGPDVSIVLWALVPLAAIAALLPARVVEPAPVGDGGSVMLLSGAPPGGAMLADAASGTPAPWYALLGHSWWLGAALVMLVLVYRQWCLRRRLRPVLRAGNRVLVSARCPQGPFVLGLLRPRVVVPADFTARFDTRQRRLVLAHELTHIRRRDRLWNALSAGFRCVFWFNPLIHWAAARFRRDQELACDWRVLQRRRRSRRVYAQALLSLDQPVTRTPALSFGPHPLKERIVMLATTRTVSTTRSAIGTGLALALATALAVTAWAANPDVPAPGADETTDEDMFAFDVEVTVNGKTQVGELTVTGDVAIQPKDGQPRLWAKRTLKFEHSDADSGWSADVTITRMPEQEFMVEATIRKDDEVVATPSMITRAGSSAYVQQGDPETGKVAYRLDFKPVDPESEPPKTGGDEKPALRSAQVFLTIDGNTVGKRVEWPLDPGAVVPVRFDYTGEPAPWNAQVVVEKLDADRVEMCIDSIEVGDLATGAGCMMFDRATRDNGYMMSHLGESGIPYRLDMVPNIHDETDR